jgi:hypothetical protein
MPKEGECDVTWTEDRETKYYERVKNVTSHYAYHVLRNKIQDGNANASQSRRFFGPTIGIYSLVWLCYHTDNHERYLFISLLFLMIFMMRSCVLVVMRHLSNYLYHVNWQSVVARETLTFVMDTCWLDEIYYSEESLHTFIESHFDATFTHTLEDCPSLLNDVDFHIVTMSERLSVEWFHTHITQLSLVHAHSRKKK